MANSERINLADIKEANNPRCPCRKLVQALAKEGYADWTPLQLVHDLAISDKSEERAEFCRLVEKCETEPQDLLELAAGRRIEEIQPIALRSVRGGFAIIAGERRVLAAAYNHAKHGDPANIGAEIIKVNADDAYDLSVQENLNRKDATEVEKGHIFKSYRKRINPKTNKKFTLREVAGKLCLDYQYVRNREALTYLTEAEQKAVEDGRLGLTKAAEKGLKIRQGKAGKDAPIDPKQANRVRVMSFKQLQAHYDSHRSESDDYRRALADVCGLKMSVADKESDKRLKEAAKEDKAA